MARLSSLTQWGSIVSASVQQEAALYWNIPLMTVRCAAKKEGLLALLAAGDGGEGRREDEEARVDGVYDVRRDDGGVDRVRWTTQYGLTDRHNLQEIAFIFRCVCHQGILAPGLSPRRDGPTIIERESQ